MAYGWNAFYKPQGYTRHPESLAHGRQEERVMLSPARACIKREILRDQRVADFLQAEAFDTLVRELSMRCAEVTLAEVLTGLRGLYGDL